MGGLAWSWQHAARGVHRGLHILRRRVNVRSSSMQRESPSQTN